MLGAGLGPRLRTASTRAVVSAGLVHDWRMDEDLLGPLVDRVGGFNLTTEMGQALDYVPGDYSRETGATDYLMDWLHGKNTLTFGVLLSKDVNQGKAGPGGYYGRPLCLLLDGTHTLRCYWSDNQQHDWTLTAPSLGAWHTIVFQLDIPSGTARCWVNGAPVTLTLSTTFPTGLTFNVPANASYRKWYIGASSSSLTSHVTDGPTNAKFGRMFATSALLTLEQAETLLRGAPADFPTLPDGHIFVLDTEGPTVTCKRNGVSTLTHTAAALNTNWANGARLVVPYPQKALGRGVYGGGQGVGFQTTGPFSRATASYGPLAAPITANVLPTSGDFTVEVWARQVGAPAANATLLWLRSSAGDSDGVRLFTTGTSATVFAMVEGGTDPQLVMNLTAAQHANQWRHYVLVYTGGQARWFWFAPESDTETAGTALTTLTHPGSTGQRMALGASGDGSAPCDNGQVGRVLIYNRALSAAERLANHKAMRGSYA